MTKIFYDGNCPICSKEINFYKKLSISNSTDWYDIHSNKEALNIVKKSREECLKLLHVLDDNNNLFTGVEAFILIWKKTKYFKYLAYLINFKVIRVILNLFYKLYAKARYKKLYLK